MSKPEDWKFDNGSLYFKNRLYIPEPARPDLVRSTHESLHGGHGGYYQTYNLLSRDYWWPGMTTFVRRFIQGCATCQLSKILPILRFPH